MAKKIFDKEPQDFISTLTESLKKIPEFVVPEWAFYVKTGTSRARPAASKDFWFVRTASILRQLYIKGVVGVGRLQSKYGSRKDRGGRPAEFRKASGKIIRTILQQAESAGLVEKVNRFQHGRRLTDKGKALLDSIQVEAKPSLKLDELKIENLIQSDIQETPEMIETEGEENGE